MFSNIANSPYHAAAGSIPQVANPVGGQVDAGQTSGYKNRQTDADRSNDHPSKAATVPSAVRRGA